MLESERTGDPALITTRTEAESYQPERSMAWPTFFNTTHLILNVDGCVLFGDPKTNIFYCQHMDLTWHRCTWFEQERAKGERPIIDIE